MTPGRSPAVAEAPAAASPTAARFPRWVAAGFGAELVRVEPGGKKPTESGWQAIKVTRPMVDQWSAAAANVGLRTRVYPAVDLDVDDQEVAAELQALTFRLLGESAVRTRSNSPRCAILYRLDGESFEKKSVKFTRNGRPGKVEVLANGQQIVVDGLHPTGVELEWTPGRPAAATLPTMSVEGRDRLLEAVRVRLAELGCEVVGDRPPAVAPARPPRPPQRQAIVERARRYLVKVPGAISGSGGHAQTLTAAAHLVRGFDLDPETALELLTDDFNPRCEPPWSEKELRHKVKEAEKFQGIRQGQHIEERPTAGGAAPAYPTERPAPVAPRDVEAAEGTLARHSIVPISTIPREKIDWAWPGRFAFGKHTDVSGDPGDGKSLFNLALAAQLTRGLALPFGSNQVREPRNVLFLSTEDDAADTIRPRLEAAGGDVSRLYVQKDDKHLELPRCADELLAIIRELHAAMVVIDPLFSYIGDLDPNDYAAAVAVCDPLKRIAAETHCIISTVRHLNKANGQAARYRAGGSIGWQAKPRVALSLGKDPNDKAERVITLIKGNVGAEPLAATFRLGHASVDGEDVVRVLWGEERDISADEVHGAEGRQAGRPHQGPGRGRLHPRAPGLRRRGRTAPPGAARRRREGRPRQERGHLL